MTNIVPTIDKRNQEQLVPELRRLIYQYCSREWTDLTELEADKKVDALVHIFTNMTGKVIDRLNKAPEKNFISFLNLIGIHPTPPRAAKVPLLFKQKPDADPINTIPAGTKVSAQPENQAEVIFETEKDLTVIQPRLVRAVSLDPKEDQWSNQDYLFSEEPSGQSAKLFRGDSTVIHRLYLGQSELLGFGEENSRLSVYFNKPEAALSMAVQNQGVTEALVLNMDWFCFDEEGNTVQLHPEMSGTLEDTAWRAVFRFNHLSGVHAKTITGYEQAEVRRKWSNKWIFAELKTPITASTLMPDIEDIRMELNVASPLPLTPDLTVHNGNLLDMGKDYYPFGEKPKVNDTFYIACREAFSKANAQITLTIELSDPEISKLPDTSYVRLGWEYWNGKEWLVIGSLEELPGNDASAEIGNKGSVASLTASGTLRFQCPGIKPLTLNGEEGYWIRVRITGGNYGEEAKYEYEDEAVKLGEGSFTVAQLKVTQATYAPPSIRKLGIAYSYTLEAHPQTVLTENNFSFEDKTAECLKAGEFFKPFYPCTELAPTFYLGFDRDIRNLPVSLFFPLTGEQLGRPVVAWEYWDGRRWLTLSVNDEIRGFTRREILQFAVPSDIEKRALFGTEQYWIRARLDEGRFEIFPQVDAIPSNAVWARNSYSVAGEIPGSSNGEENQSFQLSKSPVLPGQSLRVREASGQGEWVLWEEVATFSLSTSDGRHYMLDRSSGAIIFGDGRNGMIPPTGIDNIQCDYKHGGGAAGNVAAGAITKIWDSFSWLDSVTNPVAADGGFDQEEADQAEIRGPHTLKSWDRGVTAEDMEWLVREAMPQIAKVKCLSAMNRDLEFVPGTATIIVVPDTDEPKPVPSQELLSEIEAYLCDRASATLDTNVPGIAVIGPDYVQIGVEAAVAFTSVEQRKVAEGRIIDNLKQFFHPLYGGDGKKGWELGQNLYISEVYAVIKNTPGVDYVSGIVIKASVQCFTVSLEPLENGPYKPLAPYPKYSAVRSDDNSIQYALAERVEAGSGVKSLVLKGFKKNGVIRLRYRTYEPVQLIVVSIDGDILECQTLDGQPLERSYPEGSDLEFDITDDLTVRTYILNSLASGATSFFVKIAVFERGDIVFLSRADEYVNTTPLKIRGIHSENIFLEEDELIYGGTHLINKPEEHLFSYLLDKNTGLLHDLTGTTADCRLAEILKEDRKFLTERAAAPGSTVHCPYCFPAEQ
ncbi:putative baseplate assembly protein [Paenibacillus sp. P32E]|uniref:putative baseplate assembly protein n=1 Tax=Paenibacillus sp. P32E TaxID=1349434 RepID=UPI00093C7C91|nr:putative baseplate assembly protein [Paenibacillus sp. P32E]OKP83653.1 putative baseplate assembly protein [Paenibacillus sp. P32E]